MNKFKINILLLLFSSALLFNSGCTKNTLALNYVMTDTSAHVKINFASTYARANNIQIKINGQRVGSVAASTPTLPFPGGAFNIGNAAPTSDYLALQPGTMNLEISIPKTINTIDTGLNVSNVDSIVLFYTQVVIPDYRYYTVNIADTGSSTQVSVLQNDLTQPDSGYFNMRFVNLIPNSTAVDVYYQLNGVATKVASNIVFMGASPYITIPGSATGPLIFISAGLPPTNPALVSMTLQLPNTNERVYDAFAEGFKLVASGPQQPLVGVIYER